MAAKRVGPVALPNQPRAGPSILVFFERCYENVCDLVRQIFRLEGRDSEILVTHIAERGFEVGEEAER